MGIKNTVTSFNYGAGAGDCNPNCYLQTQDYNVCFKAETGSNKIHIYIGFFLSFYLIENFPKYFPLFSFLRHVFNAICRKYCGY